MGLEDLATGVSIDFRITGFDVLVKLPKTLDAASASSDKLTGSLAGLADAFTGLIRPVSTATDDIMGFTAATTGAAAAARSSAEANRAATAGMGSTGAAARRAKSEFEDLRATLVATKSAMADLALANAIVPNRVNARLSVPSIAASFGATAGAATDQTAIGAGVPGIASSGFFDARRSAAPEQTAIGAGVSGIASSGFFGGRAPAPASASVTGYGPFIPGGAGIGGAMIGGPTPVTGTVTRMPGTGGAGGGNIGGFAAAAAAGGAGGGGFGAIAGLGAGLAGRGMPLLAQVGKAGLDAGLKAAKLGAEVGLGVAIDGVVEASKMQTLMFGVKNSTGASNAQMRQLQQSAYDVGDLTGMSANEAAKGMVNIARASGGVFRKKDGTFDMAGLNAIIPTVMEAAKIQNITRGTNVDDAATTMMETVHLFRDFRGTAFTAIADELTRLSEMAPTSLKAANKQFTMFEPQFKTLGISDKDAMATYAMLARAGYGTGKGGTNINDLVGAALPALELTRHAQTGKLGLLEKYGFVDRKTGKSEFFTNDKADLLGFYGHIADLSKQYGRDDLVTSFKSMFGMQGGRIADLVSDPQIAGQIRAIEQIMGNPNISLKEQFKGYREQFGFQAGRAGADFQSLTGELMTSSLPGLTKGFHDLGDALHGAQHYLHQHKDIELRIQRDVIGMVSGTENFLVSHRKGFQDLGADVKELWMVAEQAGPTVSAVASGLLILTQAAAKFTSVVVGGPLGVLFRTVNGIEHPNETMTVGQRAAAARALAANGGRPLPAPPPPTLQPVIGSPGQRAEIMRENAAILAARPVTVINHFHGPAQPRAVASAVRGAVEAAMNGSGHIVTSARKPAALTTPSR